MVITIITGRAPDAGSLAQVSKVELVISSVSNVAPTAEEVNLPTQSHNMICKSRSKVKGQYCQTYTSRLSRNTDRRVNSKLIFEKMVLDKLALDAGGMYVALFLCPGVTHYG